MSLDLAITEANGQIMSIKLNNIPEKHGLSIVDRTQKLMKPSSNPIRKANDFAAQMKEEFPATVIDLSDSQKSGSGASQDPPNQNNSQH
ncbi:unnamed protein product [Oikopleura dioica]|uniref:Uncharacterized protein n=1 Tax=Oikopleura dioica TaxID=34765 RepID=E4WQD8_OIKDI|nr:unnamed protein product [Oikopleura dioica]